MPLPPLVSPAAELTRDEVARYSRHLVIPDIGVLGQKRLKNARVLVIGAGGLGSPTLLYLAAAGVGTLGIVDFDTVDESNLQRQIIHGTSDIGRLKVHSARDSIAEINPFVTVRTHETRLDVDNAVALFADYDLIIDGSDNFATRYLVNDAAVLAHKPYVWGSIYRFSGQVSVFWEDAPDAPDAPDGTARGVNYRDLYPEPPPPGSVPSCAEGGVLGILCASIASVMGTEAIKLITGIGESLLGRLMIYDALAMSYRTIDIFKDPQAPAITGLVDYEAFCGVEPDGLIAANSAITPGELRDLMDSGAAIALIDVREPVEWEINRICGAVLIPQSVIESGDALAGLAPGVMPVLYCKTGVRSAQALAALHRAGFANAVHLRGGIVA
ncbi:MAG: adenylyltransferase/sulfurtransferase MoeZ, partial [Mycobacterium sp.]|nr:adenylyltransferase/sulfurtransferase MoeZ [Mycobacterium sp.]